MKKINLIIFGGSSEIAKKLISKNKKFSKIFVFSSKTNKKKISNVEYFFVKDYKISKLKKILEKIIISNMHIVLFMGKNDDKLLNSLKEKEIDFYLKVNLVVQIKIINLLLKSFLLYKPRIYVFSSTFINIKSFSSPIYSSSKIFLESMIKKISLLYKKLDIELSIIKIGLTEGGLKKRINKYNEKLLYKYQKNKKMNLDSVANSITKILYKKKNRNFFYKIY